MAASSTTSIRHAISLLLSATLFIMAHSMEGQDLRSILRELPTISSNLEGLRFAKHFAGQSHSVYKVENDSGKCFILRVPKDALAAELTERGLKIAKHIKKKKPTIQIPEVFYQAPGYTVLEFLGGNPIGKWDKELSNEWRHQWLDGFAGFLAELWTCPILDDDSREYSIRMPVVALANKRCL